MSYWGKSIDTIDEYKLGLQNDIDVLKSKMNAIQKHKNSINIMTNGRFIIIFKYGDDEKYANQWCFKNNIACLSVVLEPKILRPDFSSGDYWVGMEFTSKADMVAFKLNWDNSKTM